MYVKIKKKYINNKKIEKIFLFSNIFPGTLILIFHNYVSASFLKNFNHCIKCK